MNIHNFTNRQLCEYQSIFPTVAALLDHLLFTIGNGYDIRDGMVCDGDGVPITEWPEMTPERWDALIADCHAKERDFAVRFSHGREIDEAEIAENCLRYQPVSIDDSVFTEDALYADLVKMQATRRADKSSWGDESWVRPYPLSERYSDIYGLNETTPAWFLQIALNLCNAWVRFLNEAIANNDVWTPPSTRPKKFQLSDEARSMLESLLDEIDTATGIEYKEPTTDYADMSYTTKHRDMLATRAKELQELLQNVKI